MAAASTVIMLAGAGCGAEEPAPLPGERLGVVRVFTKPEGETVRLIGRVTADAEAAVERFNGEKEGPAPQDMSVSYQRDHDTEMYVEGYLSEPPPVGEEVTLGCEVFADGNIVEGAGDEVIIDETNQMTAFVQCVFREDLVN